MSEKRLKCQLSLIANQLTSKFSQSMSNSLNFESVRLLLFFCIIQGQISQHCLLMIDFVLCVNAYYCGFNMRASFRPNTSVFGSFLCAGYLHVSRPKHLCLVIQVLLCLHMNARVCRQYPGFPSLAHKFHASTARPGDLTGVVNVGG